MGKMRLKDAELLKITAQICIARTMTYLLFILGLWIYHIGYVAK